MTLTMQKPAISRSSDHRYTFQDITYPGVTTILKVLDKSDALMAWAARQTAEAALGMVNDNGDRADSPLFHLFDTVGKEGTIKALTSRSGWKRDEAATLGTAVHDLADQYVTTGVMPDLTDGTRKRVEAYGDWWKASGWHLRLSEAVLVSPAGGYGGTLDLLCRDRDGRTVLADLKTGKGVYREAGLQLTAYGAAEYISAMGSPVVYPMPKVDRYVILHVTESGVREIEVPVGESEQIAWTACCALYRWTQETKGRLT